MAPSGPLHTKGAIHAPGGIVRAAPVVIRSLELGDIRLSNVRAVVNGERLPHSLLGISALERLSGYEVRDGTLTLRPEQHAPHFG